MVRVLLGILIGFTILFSAVASGYGQTYDYSNYLQQFALTGFPQAVVVGQPADVTATVKANTDVDVHFEFKGPAGDYPHWVYAQMVVTLRNVVPTQTYSPKASLTIPEAVIPFAGSPYPFYFYVYVTLPGDAWSTRALGAWSPPVAVLVPQPSPGDTAKQMLNRIANEISASSLNNGLKTSLRAKIEESLRKIDAKQYKAAANQLGALTNEIRGNPAILSLPKAGSWQAALTLIQNLLQSL